MPKSDFLGRFFEKEGFTEDLQSFFQLPKRSRQKMREFVSLDSESIINVVQSNAAQLAEELSISEAEVLDAAMVLFVLCTAVTIERSFELVLEDLQDVLGDQIEEERDFLKELLEPSPSEDRYTAIRRTFSAPPTFQGFECKQVFFPSPNEGKQLLPGFWVTLSYFEDTEDNRVCRFFCTEYELKGISDKIATILDSGPKGATIDEGNGV